MDEPVLLRGNLLTCSIDVCTRPQRSRGICATHYAYLRRYDMLPPRVFVTVCIVEGCERGAEGRGLCHLHYERWRKTGSTALRERQTAEERFWAKVNKSGPTCAHRPDLGPCWLWTGSHNVAGHGTFWSGSRPIGAHVFSYETFVGPVDKGLQLDHLCRTPACVNWEHVEPVSASVNNKRGLRGGVTHCHRGHLYDEKNTYTDKRGRRSCNICRRAATQRYTDRKKAERSASQMVK